MTVDWSVVRRDEDGDWVSVAAGVGAPDDLPIYNSHMSREGWQSIATFAGAVATAMRGEEIDRQMRDGRLKDFVADKIASSTAIPHTLADMAVDAVREFEEANPVD